MICSRKKASVLGTSPDSFMDPEAFSRIFSVSRWGVKVTFCSVILAIQLKMEFKEMYGG